MKKIKDVAILHSTIWKRCLGDRWLLIKDINYTLTYEEGGICQSEDGMIPRGYMWNGADIPLLVRPLIGDPMDEKFATGSMFHDYGIENGWRGILRDKVFRVLLRESGVKGWKIPLMFRGVVHWRKLSNWFKSF